MSHQELEIVVRRLENVEYILQRLFESNTSPPVLQAQIFRLQELVAEVKVAEIYTQWRDKVVTFWAMYCQVLSALEPAEAEKYCAINNDNATTATMSSAITMTIASQGPAINILPDHRGSWQRAPPTLRTAQFLEEQFRNYLESYFIHLSPAGDADSLKTLLQQLAHTYRQLASLYHNQPIDSKTSFVHQLFKVAFQKLTTEKQRQFLATNITLDLRNLIIFVRGEIAFDYFRVRTLRSQYLSPFPIFRGAQFYYCEYCQQYGHVLDNCPDICDQLCFNCCQRGHCFSSCTSPAVFDF